MYAVSSAFLAALRTSHTAVIRVDVTQPPDPTVGTGSWTDTLILADLPVAGGAVTVDARSQVRRTLSLAVADPSLAPTGPSSTLAPYGNELYVRRGIQFLDGTTEYVPLGRFRIDSADADMAGGTLTISASDRSKRIADSRFLAPRNSTTSSTVLASIQSLVTDVLGPLAVFDIRFADTTGTPLLVWDQERWEAIEQLGDLLSAEVYFDGTGACVVRKVPTIADAVAWYADAGASGVLVNAERLLTRDETYNAVVATGERTDGTTAVTATVQDLDATSATYWNGRYGQVPRFYSSPLITTTGQATSAAQSLLDRVRGLTRQLSLDIVPNPALSAGDVVQVRFPDGTYERHLVDRLTIPLAPGGAMTVETRSTKPTLE